MGQKTEFKLEDWDFPEEKSVTSEHSENSVPIKLNDELIQLDKELESMVDSLDDESLDVKESQIYISGKLDAKEQELTQEELAFKRQIEDLFELLEMEKAADKKEGVRVYQTDSSPSRPWRFH